MNENNNNPSGEQKILFVDDNPQVQTLVVEMLETLGYQVESALDPITALKLIDEGGNFDAVLMDVILRDSMAGPELAAEMIKSLPDLKVLFTSGYPTPAISEGLQRFNAPLLPKPFTMAQLKEAVADLFRD